MCRLDVNPARRFCWIKGTVGEHFGRTHNETFECAAVVRHAFCHVDRDSILPHIRSPFFSYGFNVFTFDQTDCSATTLCSADTASETQRWDDYYPLFAP